VSIITCCHAFEQILLVQSRYGSCVALKLQHCCTIQICILLLLLLLLFIIIL